MFLPKKKKILDLLKFYFMPNTYTFSDIKAVLEFNAQWERRLEVSPLPHPICHFQFKGLVSSRFICQKGVGYNSFKNEPPHDKTHKMACAPSEDSDQPGYPPSLIRDFAVRSKGS